MAKPLPKPRPKPPAVNEASEIVDPGKLVDWKRLLVLPVKLNTALEDLAAEPRIISRIPRFKEMYDAVMAKLGDPAVQQAAAECNLTMGETQAILACPEPSSQHTSERTRISILVSYV